VKTWFDAHDRAMLLERVERLTRDRSPRWGRMNAHEVVCHLADLVRVALHEKTCEPLGLPLSWPVISTFVVWVMPWPRGVNTAPELRAGLGMTSPMEFERDKRELVSLLRRFSEHPVDRGFGPSPAFGRMSRATWGRFMWRHLDHHLRQFGL
jgi:hypothetical protein